MTSRRTGEALVLVLHHFDDDELAEIDRFATEADLNIWATSSDA